MRFYFRSLALRHQMASRHPLLEMNHAESLSVLIPRLIPRVAVSYPWGPIPTA